MLSRLPGFEWQHFEQWYFGGALHAPSTLLFARPNAAIHLDLGSISYVETLELWNSVARWRIRSGAQLGMQILLWILATAVFVIAALKNANDGRRLAAVLLMPIVMTAGPAVAYGLKVATARLPQKLDPYLYNVDRALFSISPSSALARDLEGTYTLAVLLTSYTVIMQVGFSIYFIHVWRRDGEPLRAFVLLLLGPFFGYSLYYVVPACGPKYAFPLFPHEHLAVPLGSMEIWAPPNSMPSVHFSLALFCYWLCRRWPIMRILSACYVVAMGAATLALGEHYAVDLVVAVPFAALCLSLTYGRFGWSVPCAAAVGVSLLVLRWGVPAIQGHPNTARVFAAADIVVGFLAAWSITDKGGRKLQKLLQAAWINWTGRAPTPRLPIPDGSGKSVL
jgi:hypothetical protein